MEERYDYAKNTYNSESCSQLKTKPFVVDLSDPILCSIRVNDSNEYAFFERT
jgi:hypothetical protein